MSDYTFGEWLQEWFEVYKKPKLKNSAIVPIEVAIRLHVPDELKSTPLDKVKVIDCDRAISKVPPSRTQKYLHDVISGSLAKAYRLELIPKDISVMLEPVKYHSRSGCTLSPQEVEQLLYRVEGHKLEYLFHFYVLTGCRRHEALTLRWNDIDTVRGVLLLRGTKTPGSFRYLPLTSELVALLEVCPRINARVFPFNDDYVTKTFKKFCPNHRLHDLRHTFATICAESNVHPSATQRLLGHSKIDMTMRIYTHVASDFVAKEADKINFSNYSKKKKS